MKKKAESALVITSEALLRVALERICRRLPQPLIPCATTSLVEASSLLSTRSFSLVALDLDLFEEESAIDLSLLNIERKFKSPRLVLSSYCNPYIACRLRSARIEAFVDKTVGTEQVLFEAVAAITSNQSYFSEKYTSCVLAALLDHKMFFNVLSPKELEILRLVGYGMDDKEISIRIHVSSRTAQTHRSHILKKLGLRNTPKLMAFALHWKVGLAA